LVQSFSGLVSLDISYNELSDKDIIIKSLPILKELKLLNLTGNPVTLLPFYRETCLFYNKLISTLDDIPIPVFYYASLYKNRKHY